MSDGATHEREKRGRRRTLHRRRASPAAAENRGGDPGWVWCSSAGESACESEREKMRVMPGLNTNREGEGEAGEGKWRPAALLLMASGSVA
jgi:hypothetical protein